MSSKRGRKRNDNLPPNRARDVQRAFRARRAAHLEALESRVAELEEENNALRAALNLPPANRPALGKGPTGKDKPKPYAPRGSGSMPPSLMSSEPGASSSGMQHQMGLPSNSRTDSPSSTSTRTHSLSPTSIAAVLNPAQQVMSESTWDDQMFSGRDRSDVQPSPVSNSFPVTPVSTTATSAPYSFSASGSTSSSRQSLSQSYGMSMAQNYPHTADRPMGDGYPDTLFDRRFPFSQSAFPTTHDTSHTQFHAQSPTSAVSIPPQRSLQTPMTYAHRRSITEPQTLRNVLMNTLPSSLLHQSQQSPSSAIPRGQSPMSDNIQVGHLRAAEFDMDRVGQMNSLPS